MICVVGNCYLVGGPQLRSFSIKEMLGFRGDAVKISPKPKMNYFAITSLKVLQFRKFQLEKKPMTYDHIFQEEPKVLI